MKNTSKILSILFLIGGLGIIIAAFFLLLKSYQEEDIFYLNLVVTCLVYSLIVLRLFDVLGSVDKVAQNSSGYGLKWYGIWFYAPFALGIVVASIIIKLSFNFCLIAHLVLLFILLLFFFLGSLVKNNVNEVIGKIEARKSNLKEIAAQIALLDMQNKLNVDSSYQELIDKLRENVRFITASDNPVAVALENKLIEKIRLITGQIERGSSSGIINDEFQECMSIIELRKKQY